MPSWMRRGGPTAVTSPKVGRGLNRVDAGGVCVVEDVEGAGREAEVRRLLILVGSDGEVVSPAEVEIDVGGQVLSVARDAVGARVE